MLTSSPVKRDFRTFAPLFFAIFNTTLGMGIVAPFLPLYAQHFGASKTAIGLVFGVFALSRSALLPVVGRLTDKWAKKPFIGWGLLLFALSSSAYILCGNVLQLIGARVLHGLAAAMVVPAALAYMAEMSPEGKEAGHMGLFNAFFFGGLAAGPLLGGGLKDLWGMKSSFVAMGALSLVAAIVTFSFLPRDRALGRGRKSVPWRTVFGSRPLLGILLVRFSFSIGIGITWTFLPLMASGGMGLSSSKIGLLISLNVITATLLQAPSGFLSDRLGRKGFVVVGGLGFALCIALLSATRDFTELLAVNLLFGIFGGLTIPALMGILVEEGKHLGGMGTVMGVTVMVHSLGMFLGPIMGGMVAEGWGVVGAFTSGAAIGAAGTAGFWAFYRRRGT